MGSTRLCIPALAVTLLSACTNPQQPGTFSASTVTETASARSQGIAPDSQSSQSSSTTAQAGGSTPKEAMPGDRDSALQKVSLTLSSVSDPGSKAYVIGPRDVLEVSVFKVPELSKTVLVSEAGTINYPLIGELQASGRTARQVEQDLTRSLGTKYLQSPQISVTVREFNSQRVTLDGAFKRTGVVALTAGLTLLQATANAGFDMNADETVIIFRQSSGKRTAFKYDVSRIREGRDEDIPLEAGDVLIAPTSTVKEGVNAVFRFLPLGMLAIPYL